MRLKDYFLPMIYNVRLFRLDAIA